MDGVDALFARHYREALEGTEDTYTPAFAMEYMGSLGNPRRLRTSEEDRSHEGLARRERQLLEDLRISRQRLDESRRRLDEQEPPQPPPLSPYSVNYLPSVNPRRVESGNRADDEGVNITNAANRSNTIRDYIRERNLDRTRRNEQSAQARRQSINASTPAFSSTTRQPDNPRTSGGQTPLSERLNTIRERPPPNPASELGNPIDPWATIENAMNRERALEEGEEAVPGASDTPTTAPSRTNRERQSALVEQARDLRRQRELLARASHQPYVGDRARRYEFLAGRARDEALRANLFSDGGLGTAGVGFSPDGRAL